MIMNNLKTLKVKEDTYLQLINLKYSLNIKSMDELLAMLLNKNKHTQIADEFFKEL